MNHTPGPWRTETESNGEINLFAEISRGDEVRRRYIAVIEPNEHANAKLIAAAPDMYRVLRDVAALLPCAARLHPKDLEALQTRVCEALAKIG